MKRPLRPCKQHGCNKLVKSGYCETHQKIRAEHYKQYASAQRDYDRNRLSSRERGYDRTWEKFRNWYLRKNPICAWCGAPSHIPDHIIPLPEGPKYDLENLRPLCQSCHNKRHHATSPPPFH